MLKLFDVHIKRVAAHNGWMCCKTKYLKLKYMSHLFHLQTENDTVQNQYSAPVQKVEQEFPLTPDYDDNIALKYWE